MTIIWSLGPNDNLDQLSYHTRRGSLPVTFYSTNFTKIVSVKDKVTFHIIVGEDDIRVRAIANTTGWIGFGISPNGTMAGADLIIAGFNSNTSVGYVRV
jgi:hypothetical protein